MKKNLFFYVLMGSWGWVVQGSTIVSQIPNLNVSVVDNFEQQNEIYNRIGVTDEEYLLMELLLHCMNLRTPIEKKETEKDIKIWFKNQLDTLLQLQDPAEYEVYKKALIEEVEWYGVIYSDLPVIRLLKGTIDYL